MLDKTGIFARKEAARARQVGAGDGQARRAAVIERVRRKKQARFAFLHLPLQQ